MFFSLSLSLAVRRARGKQVTGRLFIADNQLVVRKPSQVER